MTARRSTWDAVDRWRHKPVEDDETDCKECQGTGLADGPDGPPCQFCDGSGVW